MNHLTDEAPDSMILKESGELNPNPKIQEWRNTDLLLRSWIIGTLSEEALGHVVGMTTAREVWTSLEVAYLQATKEREIQLKRQLQMPNKEGTSLGEYLMQFKSICDSLAAIQKPVSDEDKTVQLSHCLGKKYEETRLKKRKKPIIIWPSLLNAIEDEGERIAVVAPMDILFLLEGVDLFLYDYSHESIDNLSQALVSTTLSDTQDQDPTWYTDTGATSHMTYDKGTPEQNGIAERKHRHLVETGLTMLFHAQLPKHLWVDAFTTAVYLINRLPSSVLQIQTLFYKLYGIHPTYSSLKHHTSSSSSPRVQSTPSLLGSPAPATCPAPPVVSTPAPLVMSLPPPAPISPNISASVTAVCISCTWSIHNTFHGIILFR
uniref:Integrase catalytic domain-containing protein n=1 Tax=Fagus sylvatica TaxID=28930 RepID=A0A2N9HLA9_FAGSY